MQTSGVRGTPCEPMAKHDFPPPCLRDRPGYGATGASAEKRQGLGAALHSRQLM